MNRVVNHLNLLFMLMVHLKKLFFFWGGGSKSSHDASIFCGLNPLKFNLKALGHFVGLTVESLF